MAQSYVIRALVEEIQKDLQGGVAGKAAQQPVDLIPCQYNRIIVPKLPNGRYPAGNKYPDRSWEGAKVVTRGGARALEYYSGYLVIKDSLGRCLIPATPNNIKRLDAMKSGKRQEYGVERFRRDDGTMGTRRVRKWVSVPPAYTRLEADAAYSGDIDSIVAAAVKKALEAKENPLPPDEVVDFEEKPVPAPAGVVDLPREEDGQPETKVSGGDGEAPPPAEPPQPVRKSHQKKAAASLSPAALASLGAGEEY